MSEFLATAPSWLRLSEVVLTSSPTSPGDTENPTFLKNRRQNAASAHGRWRMAADLGSVRWNLSETLETGGLGVPQG